MQLLTTLRPDVQQVLEVASSLADDVQSSLYLVGGAVRDGLLGRPVVDLDLTIEGHALVFAQALALHFKVPCRTHGRFQTGAMRLPSGLHVDVAMARSETYPVPASLPVVRPASIEADLARRDFTINAIAVRLDGASRGEVVDPHAGRHDLERGVVRILHGQSFVDDPTRIFRAVRFEQRFDFRLEDVTESLARRARHDGVVGRLSAYRLKDEMLHVLQEPAPLRCLLRLEDLDLLTIVHPQLRVLSRRFEGLSGPAIQPQHVIPCYGAALLSTLSAVQWHQVCRRFSLQPEVRRFGPMDDLMGRLLRAVRSPGAAYLALRTVSETALAYVEGRVRHPRLCGLLHQYRTHWRHIEPLVSGHHLQTWGYRPGRTMPAILDALMAAQVDQAFDTLNDAQAYAISRFPPGQFSR